MHQKVDTISQQIQETQQVSIQIQNSEQIDSQQNKIQEKYCGGLLNKSDPFLLKVLKLFLVILLFPLVLLYKFMKCTYYALVSFCKNYVYNCLIYLYEKSVILCNYFKLCLEKIWALICRFFKFIYNVMKKIIIALGKCSIYLLDLYANFAMKTIFKFALIRGTIQEFTSILSVPITLKIIVPFFLFIYNYIYTPIINFIIKILKFIYNRIIVSFCHLCKFVLLQICIFLKYVFQTIIYETIILNITSALIQIAINLYMQIIWNFYQYVIVNFYKYFIIKFMYHFVLVSLYKLFKAIFYDFLYKIICVNMYKGLRYFIVEIICNLILYNMYRAIRYFCVEIVYAVIRYLIVRILYEIILCNIWQCQKWLCKQIKNVMVFIYEKVIVNICKCLRWIFVEFFYKMVLKKLYDHIIEPSIMFLYKIATKIFGFLVEFLIQPIQRAVTFIFNVVVLFTTKVFCFMQHEILNPLWRMAVSIVKQLIIQIQKLYVWLGNLVTSIWEAVSNLFTRKNRRNNKRNQKKQ